MWRNIRTIAVILLSFPGVLLLLPSLQAALGRSGQAPPPIAEARAQRVSPIGAQPLHFEPNEGQADPRVAYLARGRGYALFLTSDEVVVGLQQRGNQADAQSEPAAGGLASPQESEQQGAAVRLHLVGGNPESRISGLDRLPGRSHYFLGNDPERWRRDIPHYAKVKMDSVYPGIDLVFYGTGRQLECDFLLAPGADPSGIRLAVRGAARPRLTAIGDLKLGVGEGSVILQAPVAYQEFEGQRRAVPSRFVIAENAEVGFVIGTYDASQPLVIDPVLKYSTYLGGGYGVDKSDWGYGIAVDDSGNAYVAGLAYPTDFPTTDGAFDRVGGYAGFVTKFDQNGALVYSTFLGGSGYVTQARAIAVDSTGHAYVTGQTGRTDFPTTQGAFQTSCAPGGSPYGCNDAFVVKLTPEGSELVYSTYLGGPSDPTTPGVYGDETGHGIAIDTEGNAYVTGLTRSNDFPVTANAFQKTWAGGWADVFVAKLNASGSALVYATYLGGTGGYLHGDEAFAIAVDGQSHAYVTGMTTSADFPTTVGAFRPTSSGNTNGFISKLNADGSALVYSTYLAGPGSGNVFGGRGIAVDGAGNAYVTGGQAQSGFPTTPGAFQPQCTPTGLCADAFVLKLNPTGTALVWSTYLGGTAGEQGNAIALDAQGHVYVTGQTDSVNFPLLDPVQGTNAGGANDAFVTNLSADGSHLIYSTYLGGGGDDAGFGIAVDQFGTAYVTGGTWSTNFPTLNPVQSTNHGVSDAFVFRLTQLYDLTVTRAGTGTGTVTSDPAGIACGATCSARFEGATTVTLTAAPSGKSIFMGWTGAGCTGTGPCTVTMSSVQRVTGSFGLASVTSLTANLKFPVPAGTPVTWTATAKGGRAPYTYQFWVFNGTTWTMGRDWSASNTWTWSPALPGSSTIQVWVRNAGSTNAYDAWLAAGATIAVPSVFTVTSVTPSASSVTAGTPVRWTATALSGTGPYTYRFLVWDGATWTVGQEWSASNTWTWTPPAAGTYSFQVWARNAGSVAAVDAWRSFGPMTVELPGAITVTRLSSNRLFPVPAGTPVTWTASAIGGTGPYTYKFFVFDGASWSVGQDWSASNTWEWVPSMAGSYRLQVWARNASSVAAYDAWRGVGPYTVGASTALGATGLSADRVFPVPARTPVTWTATAIGGAGPYSYRFNVFNGATWTVGQDWSAANTWTWVPPTAGTYFLQVWVRNAGSGAVYDAWLGTRPVAIGGAAALSVRNITTAPGSPLVVGGPAVIAATATGGTGPYTYQFLVYNGATWSIGQNWSSSSTLTWTPPAAGSYSVQVWIRNAGSGAAWDAWGGLGLLVLP